MRLSRKMISLFGVLHTASSESQSCQDPSITTCADCVLRGPDCSWCADDITKDDMGKQRMKCGRRDDLKAQGCGHIEADQKSFLTVDEKGTKIKPEKATIELRHGESYSFQIDFKSEEFYPIDMYYVMDLSQSMADDLANLKNLAEKLTKRMNIVTGNDFRIGHGSFVDKPVMPFISIVPADLESPCGQATPCEPAYNFRNNLNLTRNEAEFFKLISETNHSSNLDQAEAGLDGIMQAVVCKDLIGWEDNRHKLIVYSSDAPFHVAGDGKLGGILEPNDKKCHTTGDLPNIIPKDKAIQYDYPSIGQIVDVISKNEILMIFAVTDNVFPTYTLLSNLLPQAQVGNLSANSDNVIEIIEEKYNRLAQQVKLQKSDLPSWVEAKAQVKCKTDEDVWVDGWECSDIIRNQVVTYNVTLTWNGDKVCPSEESYKSRFSIFGMDAISEVTIKFICDCDCPVTAAPIFQVDKKYTLDKRPVEFSCNNGTYTCGQCVCPGEQTGNMCECNAQQSGSNVWEGCMNPDSADGRPCSASGICVCGQCQCQKFGGARDITGLFCECDSDVCHKDPFNHLPCGGPERGKCNCDGTCGCLEGWSGDSCSCSTNTNICINPLDKENLGAKAKECSGNGQCSCGKCECSDFNEIGKYTGTYCENFNSQCEQHEDCAKCLANAFNQEGDDVILAPKCVDKCYSPNPSEAGEFYIDGIVATSDNTFAVAQPSSMFMSKGAMGDLPSCVSKDNDGCQFTFGYKMTPEKKVKLFVSDDRACPEPVNIWLVVGGILGGVVFLGLIILALIKFIICWISHMEVKEFEKLRSKDALTCGNNPIYRKPETTHRTDNVKYRGASMRS